MPPASALDSLAELAAIVTLPDPLPPPGSGWAEHSRFLRIAHGEAAKVVDKVIERMPEAAGAPDAAAAELGPLVRQIAADALSQIAAGALTLSGSAVLEVPGDVLGRAIVSLWRSVERGMPVYRAERADGQPDAEAASKMFALANVQPADDYRRRLGMAQAIVQIDRAGLVDLIGRGGRVGGWPAVVVGLVIGLALLAWAVVAYQALEAADARFAAACLGPDGKLLPEIAEKPELAKLCRELAKAGSFSAQLEAPGWLMPAALGLGALLVLGAVRK